MDQKKNISPFFLYRSLTKKKKKKKCMMYYRQSILSLNPNARINVGNVCFCKTMDMSKPYISSGAIFSLNGDSTAYHPVQFRCKNLLLRVSHADLNIEVDKKKKSDEILL